MPWCLGRAHHNLPAVSQRHKCGEIKYVENGVAASDIWPLKNATYFTRDEDNENKVVWNSKSLFCINCSRCRASAGVGEIVYNHIEQKVEQKYSEMSIREMCAQGSFEGGWKIKRFKIFLVLGFF